MAWMWGFSFKLPVWGTSLVFQWLRLCASTVGGTGSIPGWRAKIPHALWLWPQTPKLEQTNKQQKSVWGGWSRWKYKWSKFSTVLIIVEVSQWELENSLYYYIFIILFIFCTLCMFKHFHHKKLKFFTDLDSGVLMMFTILILFNLFDHLLFWDIFWVFMIICNVELTFFPSHISLCMKCHPHLKCFPWEGFGGVILLQPCVFSHLVVSDSVRPQALWPARFLRCWNSPGENTGVGSHSFLLGVFSREGSNPGLPHCRQILYHLSHQGSVII